jgi:hypothetical protein
VLSPFDDHPVHQIAEPVAHLATGDRNAFERYRFHGFAPADGLLFGATLALYPNRKIVDASLSVVVDGVQHSVHASARLEPGCRDLAVGPFTIGVLQPLQSLTVRCDGPQAHELGIDAALTFHADRRPVAHRRRTERTSDRMRADVASFTQWGSWDGHLQIDGTRIELDGHRPVGLRARSWGVEPVGEPAGGAPLLRLPQRFWVSSATRLGESDLHTEAIDDDQGRAVHADAQRIDADAEPEPLRDHAWTFAWEPGTRRPATATLIATPWNAPSFEVGLTPVASMALRGLGSQSPDWLHGSFKAEAAVGRERWVVADLDPSDVHNLHWLQLCHATTASSDGVALLEVLPLGPHGPSGLRDFVRGFRDDLPDGAEAPA